MPGRGVRESRSPEEEAAKARPAVRGRDGECHGIGRHDPHHVVAGTEAPLRQGRWQRSRRRRHSREQPRASATTAGEHKAPGEDGDEQGAHEGDKPDRSGHRAEPPVSEAPCGPLGLAVDAGNGGRHRTVGCDRRTVGEPAVEETFEVAIDGHAGRPPTSTDAFVRLECGAHGAMGVVKARAGRARRDAECLGDLGWGIAREVVQDEDGPLIRRQPPEAAFELIPIRDGQQVVGRGRSVDRQRPEVGAPTTLARRLGDADVDEHAAEPRVEPVRIAEPSQVTPGDHQRVLDGVLGPIDVAEDAVGDREEPVDPGTCQVDECRPVAPLCRLDEIPIHRSTSCHAHGGRRQPYWSPVAAERSVFSAVNPLADRDLAGLDSAPAPRERIEEGAQPCIRGSCCCTLPERSCS